MLKEILVIDDNPDIRFLICNILKEQNFKVRSAANYDQAVLEINNRLPDLAIIDIKLDKPDKDGIDLLKLVNKKKGRLSVFPYVYFCLLGLLNQFFPLKKNDIKITTTEIPR